MTVIELKAFLLCSTAINYGVLLVWFGVFVFAHDWLYKVHSRWFKLSTEHFDAVHYAGIALYKIGILLFNLAPLMALYSMSSALD